MKRLTIVSMFAVSCAPQGAAVEDTVLVKNFASGLVCGARDGESRVCFQTEDIPITGEGDCVYAGSTRPCTWYGFSFDYELTEEEVTLQCSWSSSDRSNVGNPSEELAAAVKSGSFEIELTHGETSFFNPQYSLLPVPLEEKGKVIRTEQACSFRGVTLFEVAFTLRYPER